MNIEEHSIVSSSGEYSRNVWYLPSAVRPQRLCIFLDGEYYVNHMDAPATLIDLQQKGAILPVACLFVSHVNGEARHHDYTCNDRYSNFVAKDLVSWLRERNPEVSPSGHLLGGTSLSGLQAAFTSISHPETFSFSLNQSGSFWWNREWLKENLSTIFKERGRHWISVGDKETESQACHPPTGMRQEMDQISATEGFVRALQAVGSQVHFHLYSGGHEIRPWKEEFARAIQWLHQEVEPDAALNRMG